MKLVFRAAAAALVAAVSVHVPCAGAQTLRERLLEHKAAGATPVSPTATRPTNSRIEGWGDYSFTLLHDGLTRAYRVHVPKSYAPARPTPLLLSFHGGGGNMDYQADDQFYGLITQSENAGFIAVFPNGFSKLKSGKFASWNAGTCCAGARDRNVDDVGFIRQLVTDLKGQLNIDADRVYANGMSNGALFAYRLACEAADIVRAIGPVAGTDNTLSCHPSRPVSVIHFHARNDDMVLFNGGAGRQSKLLADFTAVPESIAKWVRLDGCNPTPKRVLEKPGAHCDAYTQCRDNSEVRLCVTDSGGHSWPGGRKVRTNEPGSTALSANDVMWDFFVAH